MRTRRSPAALAVAALALAAAPALSACGSSSGSTKPAKVTVRITGSDKHLSYQMPATIKGGLVQLTFENAAKGPNDPRGAHGVQLVRVVGNHSPQQVLKVVGSNSSKTPAWIRGEGGIGGVLPGQRASATVDLPSGSYIVVDAAGPGGSGPPVYKQVKVSGGKSGGLPSAATTVDAATAGKDHYKWKISGSLKPGENQITFKSGGKDAIHLIAAVKLKGNPSKAQILKGLRSQGPPPPFVDRNTFYGTAVLDGGKSQVGPLSLSGGPGKYLLFCPLSDRDGGKPHFEEGLLTTVDVK